MEHHLIKTIHNPHDFMVQERLLSSAGHVAAPIGNSDHGNQTTRFKSSEMVIIFIFFGLCFTTMIGDLKKKLNFPIAPIIIIISVAFGASWKSLSWAGEISKYLVDTDPHLIMTIFLVPIVFESAFMADGFVMRQNWGSIFMVAGVGAIGTSFLFALVFKYVFYYSEELSFEECLVLGCL